MSIEFKCEYEWKKQANGNYCIFRVPVFGQINDSVTMRNGEKINRVVGEEELLKIVENMESEKDRGWYARIMISHHEHDEARDNIGVGFADNFWTDGAILYCDFVEVTPITFDKMYNKNSYPGRSVEYCFKRNIIESIALLDTRMPYLRFPVMNLSRDETVSFIDSNECTRFFALNKNKEVFMTVLKSNSSLENIIHDAVKNAISKNFSSLTQFQTSGNENSQLPQDKEKENYADEEDEDEKFYKKFQGSMKKFMDEEMESYMDSYMKRYMDKGKEGEEKKCPAESPDSTAKMSDNSFKGHSSAGKISQNFFPNKNNFLSGYEMESEEIKSVAFMSSKDWEDTVGQKDRVAAKKFFDMNPDKEKFVEDAVRQEKSSANSYEKLWRGGK